MRLDCELTADRGGQGRYNEAFLWSAAKGYRAVRRKWYLPDAPIAKETVWFSQGDRNFAAVKADNVDIGFQYYASLNNWGRQRMQLDTGIKREVLKDLFIAVNVFDTFDSRPPTAGAAKNDVGVALSFGWSY